MSCHHMLWERQRRNFLLPIIFILSLSGDPEIAKCFHFILQMSDARVLLSALHNVIRTLSKKLSHVLWERQKKFSFTNYIHIESKGTSLTRVSGPAYAHRLIPRCKHETLPHALESLQANLHGHKG
ncbi:uncharacterized protein LOC111896517 [Lactuca sativa]|uniref:uncharacterized protein LOC111896517 n=1 Tax=Lactuca sativa TaxID=4236 RepID=UPI000CD80C0D|nr:uncharacterized protein LOC111896517 [Lactuca sativa]